MQTHQIVLLICVGLRMFAVIGGLSLLAHYYTLNGIKLKTVGDGQHGTARFDTEKEIKDTYAAVPYEPERWRRGEALSKEQGLVVGYKKHGTAVTALVDSGDIHCLMIGAVGVDKTANFLYPNIEYACASGMSWLCTDTKGDLFRNYAGIAEDCYDYKISVFKLIQDLLAPSPVKSRACSIYCGVIRTHFLGGSTCIKRMLRMRSWLAD